MALYHLMLADAWERARDAGQIAPDSLTTEGFVHLSGPEQIVGTANRFFAGRTDLILLTLAPDLLPEVRWEDLHGHGRYPHAYGPLPLTSVVDARAWLPGADGAFTRPDHAD